MDNRNPLLAPLEPKKLLQAINALDERFDRVPAALATGLVTQVLPGMRGPIKTPAAFLLIWFGWCLIAQAHEESNRYPK